MSRCPANTLGFLNLVLTDLPKIMNIRWVEHERGARRLTLQSALPVGLLVAVVVWNEARDDLSGASTWGDDHRRVQRLQPIQRVALLTFQLTRARHSSNERLKQSIWRRRPLRRAFAIQQAVIAVVHPMDSDQEVSHWLGLFSITGPSLIPLFFCFVAVAASSATAFAGCFVFASVFRFFFSIFSHPSAVSVSNSSGSGASKVIFPTAAVAYANAMSCVIVAGASVPSKLTL